jgi:hypothetical protein
MKEDREVWGDIEEVNYDSIKKKRAELQGHMPRTPRD